MSEVHHRMETAVFISEARQREGHGEGEGEGEGPQSWLELGDFRELKKKCVPQSENDKAKSVCTVQVKRSNAV